MGAGDATAKTPRLVAPAVDFHASFLDALAEYHAEGRHLELPADLLADPCEFARYVAALRADVDHPGEPVRYVAALGGASEPKPWPDGYVPQSTYWWAAGGEYLGRLALRHRLTPHMLAAALPIAAALGIEFAHLDCDDEDVASRRVIERNGGMLEREEGGSLYFLVPTR
jgi:RimJ/RimL family protein N-acetyltransferase